MTTLILALAQEAPVDEGSDFPWGDVFMGVVAVAFVIVSIILLRRHVPLEKLSWRAGYGWAFVIFAYFFLTTTWFPSWLLSQQAVAAAPRWVADLVGSGAWLVPFVAGVVGLRLLQKAGRI